MCGAAQRNNKIIIINKQLRNDGVHIPAQMVLERYSQLTWPDSRYIGKHHELGSTSTYILKLQQFPVTRRSAWFIIVIFSLAVIND